MYALNDQLCADCSLKITRWIFTEAETSQGQLDTCFSNFNVILNAFVEDGSDTIFEEHILEALSFQEEVASMKEVVFYMTNLTTATISDKFKSSIIACRAIHDILWYQDKVHIYKSPGTTIPEVLSKSKLNKRERSPLYSTIVKSFSSTNSVLFVEESLGGPCRSN